MPVSGLIVSPRGEIHRLAAALSSDGRFVVGAAEGGRLPVVIEAPSLTDAEALVEELATRNDVLFVDVVSVDFSDVGPDAVGAGGLTRGERARKRNR